MESTFPSRASRELSPDAGPGLEAGTFPSTRGSGSRQALSSSVLRPRAKQALQGPMRWCLTLAVALTLAACGGTPQPQSAGTPAGAHVDKLTKIDVKTGDGAEATPGMNVQVDYTGWLYDPNAPDKHGAKFDSSHDHGSPFSFALGQGQVIKGWDEGVVGMRVGGKRTLLIPADMGYGARGAGGVIPPNASLVFDVELLDVGSP